jgi:hypothetical protein
MKTQLLFIYKELKMNIYQLQYEIEDEGTLREIVRAFNKEEHHNYYMLKLSGKKSTLAAAIIISQRKEFKND